MNKPEKQLSGHKSTVNTMLHHGDLFFTGSYDTSIRVWHARTFQLRKILHGHTGGVYALCLYDNRLVSGSADRTMKFWNLESLECESTLQGHTHTVHALSICGAELLSGSIDSSIASWDVTGSNKTVDCESGAGLDLDGDVRDNQWGVFSLCAIPGEKQIASGHRNGAICIWDVDTFTCVKILQVDYATRTTTGGSRKSLRVSDMCVINGMLATACHDQKVRVWDPLTWSQVFTLAGHDSNIDAVCEVDGKLVSGSKDGRIIVRGGQALRVLKILNGHEDGIRSLCNVNGKLASGAFRVVQIWNLDLNESGGMEMKEF